MILVAMPFADSRNRNRHTLLPRDEIQHPLSPYISWAIDLAWYLNIVSLLAIIGWLSIDGYLSRFAFNLIPGFDSTTTISGNYVAAESLPQYLSAPRQFFGSMLILTGSVTAILILYGLALGQFRHRSTRSFLAATFLATVWIICLTNWNNIIEVGKNVRIARETAPLQEFAHTTLKQWNELTDDAEAADYAKWTAFNAYPIGKPRMIFFLGEQPVPKTELSIRSIEYSEDQAIRFELSGEQMGNWFELRLDSSPPQDFIGGLEVPFEVVRWKQLRGPLYLVRYR